jgi:hypothetical protein
MPARSDVLLIEQGEWAKVLAGYLFYAPGPILDKVAEMPFENITDEQARKFFDAMIKRYDEIIGVGEGAVSISIEEAEKLGIRDDIYKWRDWGLEKHLPDNELIELAITNINNLVAKREEDQRKLKAFSDTGDRPPEPEPPANFVEPPEAPTISRRQRWSVAELLDTEFPAPRWAIPDLIPEGLTIIGGRPKVGKSWLALQAAISVGTGGVFFNKPIERGNVLYVALEDSPRRLQDRIRKLCIPRDALITFERTWKPLHRDGLTDLIIELEATSYRLVVFDTLTRAFPGLDQNEQHIIAKIMSDIQALAINRNTAIVFNDHTRKPSNFINDPIDDIMNSTVKTAAADCILALYKVQGKFNLKGRGRDIEEIDYVLHWDPFTWCWQNEGSAGELAMTEQQTKVLEALQLLGKCQCNDVAKATNIDRGNTHKKLEALYNAGKVHKEAIGRNIYYELLHT